MARTVGPLLGLGALGPLGRALTFSRTAGGPVAKRSPKKNSARTTAELNSRARLQFLQKAWTPDIANNGIDVAWATINRQQNLPAYNKFLSANLNRWAAEGSPIFDPTTPIGNTPGTINTVAARLFSGGLVFTYQVITLADTWGICFYLTKDFSEPSRLGELATTADLINPNLTNGESYPLRGLPHGSTWFVATRTFAFDGALSDETQWFAPIIIP
jgi:hypothetical protein